jgi:malate permease and related proteins
MDAFTITFQAVAAMLGIGVLGFWIIGRRHIPANALTLLTSIATDIAIPCIVLSNIIKQFSPQKYPDWWHLPIWWIGFTIVTLCLSLLTSFIVKKDIRGEWTISLVFQNGIFFPLVIIGGLFKDPSVYLVQLFLFIFLQPSIVFSTYSLFFKNRAKEQVLNWKRIINPVIVFTIIGLIIGLAGASKYIPDFLIMIITMIGAMALPLFMLILGGNVYNDFMYSGKEGKKIYWWEVAKFILVKNLIFPMVFLGLLVWLRPEYYIALIIILQAAIPPITAIPVFAERSGGNRIIASQYIVGSFVFSIVTIPLVIFVFSRYFPFPGS